MIRLCREVMTLALEQAGYSLTSTGDPMEAWTLVKRTRFDLLILDVVMPPNKPHGIAVARTTLLSNQKQKVIYVTGSDVPEGAVYPDDAPVLRKPVRIAELLAVVDRVVGSIAAA